MMLKVLRPYQDAAVKSLWKYIYDNPEKHPLIDAPVAAGKSLLIAEFIKQVHEKYPRTRIVILCHTKELLVQDAKELKNQYPDVDYGFYCAGLGQKRLHNDVTFASIQSIHSKILSFNRNPEIIIIDEAHLISHKSNTQYRKFIKSCLELNPNLRVAGFTGTVFRADTGRLDEGENKLFDDVCYEIGMDYMIEQGYWAKPVCPNVATQMDVSGVAVSNGDYVEKQLQKAINKAEITDPCIEEMIDKGADRNKWLIFTAGVQHAEDVTASLNAHGIEARFVHSKQSPSINDQNLRDHKAGKYKALVNVAKLTTGYNDPQIDLLAFMRPTRSPVLYVQTIGRGVRTVYAEGYDLTTQQGRLDAIANSIKPDCMILDFGGVVATLGPIDQINVRKQYKGEKEGKEKGEAIMKICPSCGTECAAAQRYCLACGYSFIKLEKEAGNKAIMSSDIEPEWVEVLGAMQSKHQTPDSWQPSMKVTYSTMQGAINEFVCFQHWHAEVGEPRRYAWDMAVKWHKERLPDIPVPKDVMTAAYEIDYPQPSKILIRPKGKYFEILDYQWADDKHGYDKGKIVGGEFIAQDDEEYFDIPF